jgi:hypothetical protein
MAAFPSSLPRVYNGAMYIHYRRALGVSAILLMATLLNGCFQAQLSGPVTNATITVSTLAEPEIVLLEDHSWDDSRWSDVMGARWQSLDAFSRLIWLGIYTLDIARLPPQEQWLLITASGGRDVDRDGDRLQDEVSVLTAATWHALVHSDRLNDSAMLSNAPADLIYRRVAGQLGQIDDAQLEELLDSLSAQLLGADATYESVLSWNAYFSPAPLLAPGDWRTYIDALLNGQSEASLQELALRLLPAGEQLGWTAVPAGSSWQWQLQGELNPGYSVDFYDVDLFDTDAETIASLQAQGIAVVCYFSAGSYEEWRDDAGDFPGAALGASVDDWPGERWLDIRSGQVWELMADRLDVAMERGCDAVEPDNIDAYINDSGFPLSAADQLAYNRYLATQTHLRGMAIGLKNDLDQVESLLDVFDFSLNEQCHEFDECELLLPFLAAGKAVFIAEYDDFYRGQGFQGLCASSIETGFSTLVLPLELDDSYRQECH